MQSMTLYTSGASPYGRKALICIKELELEKRVITEWAHPVQQTDELRTLNPLSKVPCLIMEDGELVIDSPVICRRLNDIAGIISGSNVSSAAQAKSLRSDDAAERYADDRLEALCDGILAACVARVMERGRPPQLQSDYWQERWQTAIETTLAYIETREATQLTGELSLGKIALGCTLGYLDFRFPDYDWRKHYAVLAEWFTGVSQKPSFIESEPKDQV